MGTGAVYVTLSGIADRTPALTTVETVFYFLNMALFLLNTLTLLMQAVGELNFVRQRNFGAKRRSLSQTGMETHAGPGQRNFRAPNRAFHVRCICGAMNELCV
jgi:hypothetical protein